MLIIYINIGLLNHYACNSLLYIHLNKTTYLSFFILPNKILVLINIAISRVSWRASTVRYFSVTRTHGKSIFLINSFMLVWRHNCCIDSDSQWLLSGTQMNIPMYKYSTCIWISYRIIALYVHVSWKAKSYFCRRTWTLVNLLRPPSPWHAGGDWNGQVKTLIHVYTNSICTWWFWIMCQFFNLYFSLVP